MKKEDNTPIEFSGISEQTNLNDINLKETSKLPIFLNQVKNLKGRELEIFIMESVINSLNTINYYFLGAQGDSGTITERLIAMEQETSDFKITKIPKKDMPTEDEEFVIIMNYFMYKTNQMNLGFMHNKGANYFFNGAYWQLTEREVVEDFLVRVAEKTGMPQTLSRQPRIREKLLKQFEKDSQFFEKPGSREQIKINLRNGTFWLDPDRLKDGKSGVLKETDKSDFFKYQLNFDYDPDITAPKFQIYLDRVLPEKDAQYILMEYMGYIFSPMKLEKVLILYGNGSNGKSVFFEIVKALLGNENISYASMDRLTDETGYYRADLNTKLLNYGSEIGKLKDFDMFKKMASGEPITARLPYGRPITLDNYCKFMFNANTLPFVEQTDAFFRRQIILPFTQTISERERDIDLPNKIISDELSGIFNMILDGLERLTIQKGFSKSAMVDAQIEAYRREGNSVELFLFEEGFITSLHHKMELQIFFEQYTSYCSDTGCKPFRRNSFSKHLRNLGYQVERSTNGYYAVWVERSTNENVIELTGQSVLIEALNYKF